MKRISNFIKKHDNIFIFIVLALIMLANVYNLYFVNGDESYNFLNSYKMANGLTIYKDNNVIITPIFFYISSIFMQLFGKNILIYRTLNLIIGTLTMFLCYKIFKKLNMEKRFSIIFTLIITIMIDNIIKGGANYNVLAYTLYLLGLYLFLKMKDGTTKSIVQGMMIFIVFATYQKLGASYFVALSIYEICTKNYKSLLKEYATALMFLIIFLLYFYLQDNLINFLNYTVLGIGEFGSKNTAIQSNITSILLDILIPIITIIVNIIVINTVNKKMDISKNEKILLKNKVIALYTFAICAYIIAIPIFNQYHLTLASIIMLINLFYIIYFLIKPITQEKRIKRVINIIIILIVIILLINSIVQMASYISNIKTIPDNSPFFGGILDEKLSETIKEVGEYIKNNNKNTIVFSEYATLISVYTNDLDNAEFDLPFRGNLGKDGEEGLIQKIKNMKDTQFLLLHESDENKELYQFAFYAADYIKENMAYKGQINKFDIYETIE